MPLRCDLTPVSFSFLDPYSSTLTSISFLTFYFTGLSVLIYSAYVEDQDINLFVLSDFGQILFTCLQIIYPNYISTKQNEVEGKQVRGKKSAIEDQKHLSCNN